MRHKEMKMPKDNAFESLEATTEKSSYPFEMKEGQGQVKERRRKSEEVVALAAW